MLTLKGPGIFTVYHVGADIKLHLKQNKITLITIIDNTTKKIHLKIQFIIISFKNIYRKNVNNFFHQEDYIIIIS